MHSKAPEADNFKGSNAAYEKSRLPFLLAAGLIPLSLGFLDAATVTWINDSSGFWDEITNWDSVAVPTLADDLRIDKPAEIVITHRSGPHK